MTLIIIFHYKFIVLSEFCPQKEKTNEMRLLLVSMWPTHKFCMNMHTKMCMYNQKKIITISTCCELSILGMKEHDYCSTYVYKLYCC